MFHIHQFPEKWSDPKIATSSFRLFQEKICPVCNQYKIKWLEEPNARPKDEVKKEY